MNEQQLRDCICADPENCTQAVPGYRCRKSRGQSSQPPTSDEGAPGETPRTNAARAVFVQWKCGELPEHPEQPDGWDFARQLERTLHAKERELAALQSAVDCACNALTDSICASGNDAETNLSWVRKLRQSASAAPQEEKEQGEHFCMHPQCENGWIRDPNDPNDPGHVCPVCTPPAAPQADDLTCKCGTKKECLGGRSAHISNWYCPKCEAEGE